MAKGMLARGWYCGVYLVCTFSLYRCGLKRNRDALRLGWYGWAEAYGVHHLGRDNLSYETQGMSVPSGVSSQP